VAGLLQRYLEFALTRSNRPPEELLIPSGFHLLVFATGVMNAIVTGSRGKESLYMKTFTIDADNNITVHASRKAAKETGAGVFASEEQLADLIGPDNKRLVEIWNSLTGVTPVTKFANRKVATERIWKAIQSLGEQATAPPASERQLFVTESEVAPAESEVAEPGPADAETARPLEDATLQGEIEPVVLTAPELNEAVEPVATVGAQEPQGAPAEGTATDAPTPAKKARKAKKAAKTGEATGPREGSKTAQVVGLLMRESGATLEEIMEKMGWQKHTVRGFMAGAMKKAGYAVESSKSEAGARSYRINP
jgi:hypothetical protein